MSSLPHWLSPTRRDRKSRRPSPQPHRRPAVRLLLEPLERREVPAAISIANLQVNEGATGLANANFIVSLDQTVNRPVTVDYAILAGTATANNDYLTPAAGTLTLSANSVSATLAVPIIGDVNFEATETFTVQLSNPSSGDTFAQSTAIGAIANDDPAPRLVVSDPSIREGDSGSANVTFVVSLVDPSGGPAPLFTDLSLTYGTANGSATGGTDFQGVAGGTPFTIPVGQPSATLTVSVLGDTAAEGNETFTLTVGIPPASAALVEGVQTPAKTIGTATILDDDPRPVVTIGGTPLTVEQNGGGAGAKLAFTVNLTGTPPASFPVTVTYTVAGGGTVAASASDFIVPGGSATFTTAAGVLEIPIVGDLADEADEGVVVTLTGVTNGVLGVTTTATGTIIDDDGPVFSVGNASIMEGNGPTTQNLAFTITASAASPQATILTFSTANGTANAGSDYVQIAGGTVTMPANSTTVQATVVINGDTMVEANETFLVNLTSAQTGAGQPNGSLGASGTGTITDDDLPAVQIIAGGSTSTLTEGLNGPVDRAQYVVALSGLTTVPAGRTITVAYATAAGMTNPATAGSDFVNTTGTLTFTGGGSATQTVAVSVNDDFLNELNETFTFTLSNPTGATLGAPASHTTTINDNDAAVVSVRGASAVEGSGVAFIVGLFDPTNLKAPVTSSQAVTFNFNTATGTAVAADFTAVTSPPAMTIAAGQSSVTVTVATMGDTTDEANETFTATISSLGGGGANVTLGNVTANGIILDNDGGTTTPAISINSVAGAEAAGPFNFIVSYAGTSMGTAVTVNFTLAAGTPDATQAAAAAGDVTGGFVSGSVTIPNTATSVTLAITPTNDTTMESDEVFIVTLTGATGTGLTPDVSGPSTVGTGTILNDDGPALSVSPAVPVLERSDGQANNFLAFTVNAAPAPAAGQRLTINYATADGPADANAIAAIAGTDYIAQMGTLEFDPGVATRTVVVPVIGDTAIQRNQRVSLNLSMASLGAIGVSTATGIITDDDGPTVSVANAVIAEQDTTAGNLVFILTATSAPLTDVVIAYALANGTAVGGTTPGVGIDFNNNNNGSPLQVTLSAGQTTAQVTVVAYGDMAIEPDETLTITLATVVSGVATLDATPATGTIVDNDNARLRVNNPVVLEGNSGQVPSLNFVVTLRDPTDTSDFTLLAGDVVTVDFSAAGSSATTGTDFLPTSGTLTFTGGQTSTTVTVHVLGDNLFETDETLTLALTNATGASIVNVGTGTITNDDNLANVEVAIGSPVSVTEGNSGTTNALFVLTLRDTASKLPAQSGSSTVITYSTGIGTSNPATAGTDYTPVAGGTATISAGESSVTVTVPVVGDTVFETSETFLVNVTMVVGAQVSTQTLATATIVNDDAAPVLAVANASVNEGNSGTTNLVFTATLLGPSAFDTLVDFTTALATGATAASASDFNGASGRLTISAGQTTGQITVAVIGDTVSEPAETFLLRLSNPSAPVSLPNPTATGTILDDETTIALANATVSEGNSGTTSLVFNVTLSAAAPGNITGTATTADGTATAGSDYTGLSGVAFTIPAGQSTGQITVAVTGDTTFEPDETLTLSLTNVIGATPTSLTATGTLTNDDPTPTIGVGNASVAEGNSGTANLVFTVTLSNPSSVAVTATASTTGGAATSGTDFVALANLPITIPAGQTTAQVTVVVNGDTLAEADESLTLTVGNVVGANPASVTATGTITNDDVQPVLSVGSASVTEGNAGTTNLVFPVTLSFASGGPVTGTVATTAGSATAGNDFVALSGMAFTIPAGQTSAQVTVAVNGDLIFEPDETLTLTVSGIQGATPAAASGQGTIVNDDTQVRVSVAPTATVSEGDSGTTSAVLVLTLDQPAPASGVVVQVSTTAGTATVGSDFTALTNQAVTFTAGTTSQSVTVAISGDRDIETDETFVAQVSLPPGSTGVVLGNDRQTVTIANDDQGGAIQFTGTGVSGTEGNNVVLTLTRTGGLGAGVAVTLSGVTSPGSVGVSSADFTGLPQTVTFAGGQATVSVTVGLASDTIVESHDFFSVTLSNPTGGATLGTTTSARVDLVDPTGTDVDQYVNAVYEQLLGREVDQPGAPFNGSTGGLDFWRSILGAAPTAIQRSGFVQILETTQEFRTRQINRLYQQYLGHGADAASVDFWTQTLNAGGRQDVLEAALIASAEFLQLAGGTAAGLQSRTSTTTGAPAPVFAGDIASFDARLAYALGVLATPAADQQQVRTFYAVGFNNPSPTAGDLAFWSPPLTATPLTAPPLTSTARFFGVPTASPRFQFMNIEDFVFAEMMSNLVPTR